MRLSKADSQRKFCGLGINLGILGNIQLLVGTAEAGKVGAGATTKLKTLGWAKIIVRNKDKTLYRISVA